MFGIFSKKDINKELQKIENLFEKGYRDKALRKVEALAKSEEGKGHDAVRQLMERIIEALVKDYLQKADAMIEKAYIDDAVEWLEMALDYTHVPEKRKALKTRINDLLAEAEPEAEMETANNPEPVHSEEPALDVETQFETFVHMLTQEHMDSFLEMPEAFKAAHVYCHIGRYDESLSILDSLEEEHNQHPILLLERARCLIGQQDFQQARSLCEAIWEHFGDQSIDLAGSVSIPLLWTECCLRLNDPEPVTTRCLELAAPENRNSQLTLMTGLALEMAGKAKSAVDLFLSATRMFDQPDFGFHLGRILEQEGDWQNATQVLEKTVSPSCSSGACYAPPLHFPSLHLLISIYLKQKVGLKRVEELLIEGDRKLRGLLSREHLLFWAEYHFQSGDEELAEEARELAETAAEGVGLQDEGPQIEAGDSAVL